MASQNPNGLNMGASADQVRMAAINAGATTEGSKMVAEIVAEYPELDLQEVISEVAGNRGKADKNEVVGKLFKKTEKDQKEAKPQAVIKPNNAPLPGTPEYNNIKDN